jgi:hypothetical protein
MSHPLLYNNKYTLFLAALERRTPKNLYGAKSNLRQKASNLTSLRKTIFYARLSSAARNSVYLLL